MPIKNARPDKKISIFFRPNDCLSAVFKSRKWIFFFFFCLFCWGGQLFGVSGSIKIVGETKSVHFIYVDRPGRAIHECAVSELSVTGIDNTPFILIAAANIVGLIAVSAPGVAHQRKVIWQFRPVHGNRATGCQTSGCGITGIGTYIFPIPFTFIGSGIAIVAGVVSGPGSVGV